MPRLRGGDEVGRAPCPCPRASSRAAPGCAGNRASALAEMIGQAPLSSGWSMPSHISFVAPLRPAWPSWRQIFARQCACTKLDDARPGGLLGVVPQPGAARRDAGLGRGAGHLGEDQPGAAHGAGAVMREVEVVRQRRPRPSTCTSARRRRGWPAACRAARRAGTSAASRRRPADPGRVPPRATKLLRLGHEVRRAQRKVVPGDRLGARHHARRRSASGRSPRSASHARTRPARRRRRAGSSPHPRAAPSRSGAGRSPTSPPARKASCRRDGVLHRQLGAGADGEMRAWPWRRRAGRCCPSPSARSGSSGSAARVLRLVMRRWPCSSSAKTPSR